MWYWRRLSVFVQPSCLACLFLRQLRWGKGRKGSAILRRKCVFSISLLWHPNWEFLTTAVQGDTIAQMVQGDCSCCLVMIEVQTDSALGTFWSSLAGREKAYSLLMGPSGHLSSSRVSTDAGCSLWDGGLLTVGGGEVLASLWFLLSLYWECWATVSAHLCCWNKMPRLGNSLSMETLSGDLEAENLRSGHWRVCCLLTTLPVLPRWCLSYYHHRESPPLNTVVDGERTYLFKAQQSSCHSHWRVKPGLLHQPLLGAIWEPCCCGVQLRKNECSPRVFVSC